MSLFSMFFVNRMKNLIRGLYLMTFSFLPTMVILKQQNTVKRALFSRRGLCIRDYLSLLLRILQIG